MDIVVGLIVEAGFKRTSVSLDFAKPVVVHAVAGAGKTRLIKEILEKVPEAVAYTFGTPDSATLTGRRVQGIKERVAKKTGQLEIIDEYLAAKEQLVGANFLFADPQQYEQIAQEAHLIKAETHRFGKQTASLLCSLNFTCISQRVDTINIENIWKAKLRGQVIAWEPTVCRLLTNHSQPHAHPQEVIGHTYEEVTIVTSDLYSAAHPRHLIYIALTRHRYRLTIASAKETHS
ncbi:TGBp1 family protein [Klebsiella pneumoniae]|uniref:TGBp1 family protein n=1 Tax=Klebsiella pneumoniae TaxID=573 RepID=UPI00124B08D4|nr:TGBp1 family protein [Klebsiella pneumoniae]